VIGNTSCDLPVIFLPYNALIDTKIKLSKSAEYRMYRMYYLAAINSRCQQSYSCACK